MSHYGTVVRARVMGAQCYGFVHFDSAATADAVWAEARSGPGIVVDGVRLRVDRSRGAMPDWKKGPAVALAVPGATVEGATRAPNVSLEAYEDPRRREARLAAAAAIAKQARAAAPAAAPAAVLQVAAPANAAPANAGRSLVAYDDL